MSSNRIKQTTIALIYDFDSTLTPLPMQEYTVLPELGVDSTEFWEQVAREATTSKGDRMLVWMRLMLEKAEKAHKHLDRARFKALARHVKYFLGVESWFSRINSFVKKTTPPYIKVEHYLISAGLEEILSGCSIRKEFKQIFASRYYYNHHGVATFPEVLVNDTMKTQFLFRINKGIKNLAQSINDHMPEEDRAIPFRNMIYIGDGLSDVPSMTVTKKSGGFAIAVHDPKVPSTLKVCRDLLEAKRVDYFAPADYRQGKGLEKHVHLLLRLISADIENRQAGRRAFTR